MGDCCADCVYMDLYDTNKWRVLVWLYEEVLSVRK